MKNILSIHQQSYNSLKILRANVEQTIKHGRATNIRFFKYNKNRSRIASALASGCVYTYGSSILKSKEYLFKIY